MPCSTVLVPSLALVTVLLFTGPALSAVRIGTNGNDTLVGTKKNDRITGKDGNDLLKGRAGNDVYFFADNFGSDTLVEKPGEGRDTVDFHAVTTGPVTIGLVPEWVGAGPGANEATGPGGHVTFAAIDNGQTAQSIVENAIGGQGDGDSILGGAGTNVLQPGGGARDRLSDAGGWNDGAGGNPEIPASNDIYKGFVSNTGTDEIDDWGGDRDILDLRPFSIKDVVLKAVDLDGTPQSEESLQILTGPTGQIIIPGQFGDVRGATDTLNYHGHIETIKFADKTFSTTSALQSLAAASTETLSPKQARLAEIAEGLAEEARALVDPDDPLGLSRGRGE